VKHNDGGHYHSVIRIYEITPCVFLAVYGDTREACMGGGRTAWIGSSKDPRLLPSA